MRIPFDRHRRPAVLLRCMGIAATSAILVAADCRGNPKDPSQPCYNMDMHPAVVAHVVERLGVSPSYYDQSHSWIQGWKDWEVHTCAGLDAFAEGTTIEFRNIQVGTSEPANGAICEPTLGDLTMTGISFPGEAFDELSYLAGPGVRQGLVTSASTTATFGACTGTWVVSVNPLGLFEYPTPIDDPTDGPDWDETRLFDPGRPGDTPPVVIQRFFRSSDPDCIALGPQLADGTCWDTMLGYLSPL